MPTTFEPGSLSECLSRDAATGIWTARRHAAISYPEHGNADCFQLEDASFWFRHRNACITAAVQRTPPDGFVLDIGGGNGFVARALIDAGYSTVLLEPGAEGALNARTRRRIPDVINATLEDAELRPGAVPAVGLFDVIEHIEDDRAFIARVHGLLRPGGLAYVTVPAHQWLWSVTDVEAGHFRRYSTAQLSARFRDAGFEVLYGTYLFELLVIPFFLLRTLPYVLGVAKARTASDYQAEHAAGGGPLSAWLQRLLSREVGAIDRRRTLMTGTSCLLVARKPA